MPIRRRVLLSVTAVVAALGVVAARRRSRRQRAARRRGPRPRSPPRSGSGAADDRRLARRVSPGVVGRRRRCREPAARLPTSVGPARSRSACARGPRACSSRGSATLVSCCPRRGRPRSRVARVRAVICSPIPTSLEGRIPGRAHRSAGKRHHTAPSSRCPPFHPRRAPERTPALTSTCWGVTPGRRWGPTALGRPGSCGGPRGVGSPGSGESAWPSGAPVLPERGAVRLRSAGHRSWTGVVQTCTRGRTVPLLRACCRRCSRRRCGCAMVGAVDRAGRAGAGWGTGACDAAGPRVASPSVANSSAVPTASRTRSRSERLRGRRVVSVGNMCS